MTLWELSACVDGVNLANSPDEKLAPPSNEEFEAMLQEYDHLLATPQ